MPHQRPQLSYVPELVAGRVGIEPTTNGFGIRPGTLPLSEPKILWRVLFTGAVHQDFNLARLDQPPPDT